MKKEQTAFLVIVVLFCAIYFMGGDSGHRGARHRRHHFRRPAGEIMQEAESAATVPPAVFLKKNERTWSPTGRNIFLAPRETSPLPPLELLPPPLPRLPHPGLELIPPVGGAALARLRHVLIPDQSIKLAGGGGAAREESGQEAPGATQQGDGPAGEGGANGQEKPEAEPAALGGQSTLAQELTMKTIERLRLQKEQQARKRALEERRKKLDKVFWQSGLMSRGHFGPARRGDDIYIIKRKIDQLHLDASIGDAERQKALSKLHLVFFEDRGENKPARRILLAGNQVDHLEFAPSPLNTYYLRRLEADPNDLPVQLELIRPVFEAGHLQVAAEHLQAMLERGLFSPDVFAILADSQRRLFKYDQEMKVLKLGIQHHPKSVRLRGRLGQLYLTLKVPELALEEFKGALALDHTDALSSLGMGRVLVARGAGLKAIPFLSMAQTGAGLDRDQRLSVRLLRGRAYLQAGDLKSAQREFSSVLDGDPNQPEALQGAAVAALAEGEPEHAREYLQQALQARPLLGGLRYVSALCHLSQQQWSEAQKELAMVQDLDPLLTAQMRTAESYLMEKVGQDEAALAQVDLALVADPGNLSAHLQRGRVLLNVGDLEGARKEYDQVLHDWPDRPDILVVLGDVAFKSGEIPKALKYYNRAYDLDPTFPLLPARRLAAFVRERRLRDGEKILGSLSMVDQKKPFVQGVLAYYHYVKGNRTEALQRMQRLAEREGIEPALKHYAAEQARAIAANLSKEVWRDAFNRATNDLLRGWHTDRGLGISIVISKQKKVLLQGTQKRVSDRPTILYQRRNGRELDSFSVDLELHAASGVYAGMGILAFSRNRAGADEWPGFVRREGNRIPNAGIQVALAPDGHLMYRVLERFKMGEWTLLPGVAYGGGAVTLEIRVQDRKKEKFAIRVNNEAVVKDLHVATLASRGRGAELWIFSQAVIGRPVQLAADNVRIVTVKRR